MPDPHPFMVHFPVGLLVTGLLFDLTGTALAHRELVRAGWSDFADGLADVAADPRIGDDGDQFHRRYYRPDAIHPNAAGYGVMAAVTAPVLNAFEWESAGCWVRFANDEGE